MRASKRARNNDRSLSRVTENRPEASEVKLEHVSWAGPLPPPSVVEQFDHLVENGAERIFRQWELETDHRRKYEALALRGSLWLDGIGRVTAFIFAMAALLVTGWAANIGEPWVAAVLGGGTIAAVVAALVYRGTTERRPQGQSAGQRNTSPKR
jgi:uncharacterized membrane protein